MIRCSSATFYFAMPVRINELVGDAKNGSGEEICASPNERGPFPTEKKYERTRDAISKNRNSEFVDDEASEASDDSLEDYGNDEYELTDGEDLGSEDTWSNSSLLDDNDEISNDSFIVDDLCSEDEAMLANESSSDGCSSDDTDAIAESYEFNDDSNDSIVAAAMECNEERLGRACDEALRSIDAARRIAETPLPNEQTYDSETLEPLSKRSATSSPAFGDDAESCRS